MLLEDPSYRKWDAMWGGIFTRRHPEEETLISYVRKYKDEISREERDPNRPSFAQRILLQHPLAQGA
ncbi:hypothetical protein LRE23_23520 [Sulfitobacter pseudonitzschiae]|uniref:hypothetical protein n=1 Tax=Marivita cryptomonadis TaxID=505252 RepID=UPI001939514B|nr:hypothetical protein [Marivita cryptomonadis]MBM2082100.1 hypothetical protein [Pseudosulfitobacter pseudonitzschiae]MCD2330146.1 hypothetical protein [Pseudosulfitobacter pseudonitzschiae]